MKLSGCLLILFIALFFHKTAAQVDTSGIRRLIKRAAAFDPDKTDSLLIYANLIEKKSAVVNYYYGEVMATRLKGFYYRYTENFDAAILKAHEFMQKAEQYHLNYLQLDANADIGAIYMDTKQYRLAKQSYFISLQLAEKYNAPLSKVAHLNNNIAGAYQYENNFDSAYFYYLKAIKIDEYLGDSVRLAERKSNISEILVPLGKIEMARKYLLESADFNLRHNMTDDLWYNYKNLGNIYTHTKEYISAEYYYRLSYEQAKKTPTKTKFVETLNGFSNLYQQEGDYKKALHYKNLSDSIESLLVNESTNIKIAELREKYQSDRREQENNLLSISLEKEILQKRNISIIATAFLIMAIVVALALYNNTKRNKLLSQQNKLINSQKNKLAEMNLEKNSLISIVSHDLGTPIVQIQLLTEILSRQLDKTDLKGISILEQIKQSAEYGYNLINNILNIERAETGHHKVQLEEVKLAKCIDALVNEFSASATRKSTKMQIFIDPPDCTLLTDYTLLKRVLENLISNALKFSPSGKNIWIRVSQNSACTIISVKDEGPGIAEGEKNKLFNRYGRLSNKPMDNEISTGLGLYIVKRILEELRAEIKVTSTPTTGSQFEVIFKMK